MNSRKRGLFLMVSGFVLAAVAAVMVFLVLSGRTVAAPDPAVAESTAPTKRVVVAAADIASNRVISNSDVTLLDYPADLVSEDAFTNVEEVLGTTSVTPIFSGQVLLRRQFVRGQGQTGASVNIPKGKVLVAFPSTDMLNSTGAVQQGDKVDILLSLPISGTTRLDAGAASESQSLPGNRSLVAQATLQNIQVYTVGYWSPPGQAPSAEVAANPVKIITFVVDHQEALILKFVKDSGGTIDLAVRSADDNELVETDPVTLDYLVDQYGFVGVPDGSQP